MFASLAFLFTFPILGKSISLSECSIPTDSDFTNPNMQPDRSTVVHLFEWKWSDVALECERFLGPSGFGAVQISPPNEHPHQQFDEKLYPWWERYQPVSYKLKSRSGTEEELTDMISRCNKVGVRVYVDAVINHMTGGFVGTGIDGSTFDGITKSYPGVPYSSLDFNSDCQIENGDYCCNAINVRNCELSSLNDLNQGKEHVKNKTAAYLNKLLSLGAAGLRIDAAKHMWPADLKLIYERLTSLNSNFFCTNTKPFIYHEVIDPGKQAVSTSDYTCDNPTIPIKSRVKEFNYGLEVSRAMKKQGQNMKYFGNFGEDWGFPDKDFAFVFIDNHDNQRGHGGGERVTHKESRLYKMAVAFMLAWPYGVARVMSSYKFDNDWQGPPYVAGTPPGTTASVSINTTDSTCLGGWVCEHRWRQIKNMVMFRNVVFGVPATVVHKNVDHQLAFKLGNKGFFAINNADTDMNVKLNTGLAEGTYCDVISGTLKDDGTCSGGEVVVDASGNAQIFISATAKDPILAIHAAWKKDNLRTVVFIQKRTNAGQSVKLRGTPSDVFTYIEGPTKLSWDNNMISMRKSSNFTGCNYDPLNKFGENYWKTELYIDKRKTTNGWFEIKSCNVGCGDEETDIMQVGTCTGTAGGNRPMGPSNNHVVRAGYVNAFVWGKNSCVINKFPTVL